MLNKNTANVIVDLEHSNPFSIAPIIQAKVTLQEILDLIKTKMDSPAYKFEPYMAKHFNEQHPTFPRLNTMDYAGVYVFDKNWYMRECGEVVPSLDLFYHLPFTTVVVTINLRTKNAIVRSRYFTNDFIWYNQPERSIAINRVELLKMLT